MVFHVEVRFSGFPYFAGFGQERARQAQWESLFHGSVESASVLTCVAVHSLLAIASLHFGAVNERLGFRFLVHKNSSRN